MRISHSELLFASLAGEVLPMVPVAFWKHHPVADQQADTLAEATLAYQRRFDCDFVKITPASSYQLRDYGLQDAWRGDELGRRELGPALIQDPGQWAELPGLEPHEGFTARHLACARKVRESLPRHVPVVQTVFNPFFQAAVLAGPRLAGFLNEHPQAVACGLKTLTANTVALIEAFAEAGVDGIYLVAQHARAGAVSADDYRRFAADGDRACLAAGGLRLNFMHLHGEGVHWEVVRDYPLQVLHYAADADNPPAATLLAQLPYGVATGPAQQGAISRGTPEQARREAESVLHRVQSPRFILSAGCVLPLGTPDPNVHAAIAAARTPRSLHERRAG